VPRREGKWNHSICARCWKPFCAGKGFRPRDPVALMGSRLAKCCFCGDTNEDGIWVRWDSSTVPCDGKGPEHDQETP
jgi:hypothetical protein